MPVTPPSSETPKCILVNPVTMGSLSLDDYQLKLIILGLIELAEFGQKHNPDERAASDLADTIHKHVFGGALGDRPEIARLEAIGTSR